MRTKEVFAPPMQDRGPAARPERDFEPVPRRYRADGWIAERQLTYVERSSIAPASSRIHALLFLLVEQLAGRVAAIALLGYVLARRADCLARAHLAAHSAFAYFPPMAKVSRNRSNGRFSIPENGEGALSSIRDSQSGKVLALKGYGATSGEYIVRDGIDLTKPIAAQAAGVQPNEEVPPAHKRG